MNILKIFVICFMFLGGGCSYDTNSFVGGELLDNGFFSYPQYIATLGKVPLHVEGNYKFVFSGLPSEKMSLHLNLENKTGDIVELKDIKRLESLKTNIDAQITSKSSEILCSTTFSQKEADKGRWSLSSSATSASFWHEKCSFVEYLSDVEYELSLSISNVDLNSPQFFLVIVLEGGGIIW